MARGPGKYDGLASLVRRRAEAAGVIVIVLEGKHGHGFSVQAPADVAARLPRLLRQLADQIEKDTSA
jgi:hypothetical protein